MNSKKIGLLGGTFDPVHNGHLFIAAEAADAYNLERVYFIPAAEPPHKENVRGASSEDRLRMAILGAGGDPVFEVSDIELKRKGKSYTIDTVRAFREEFRGGEELYFIIGFDSYLEFDSWKDSSLLLAECRFIAAPRTLEDKQELKKGLRSGFLPLGIPALEISSTGIRSRIKEGRSIKYLVPAGVDEYIKSNNLYGGK